MPRRPRTGARCGSWPIRLTVCAGPGVSYKRVRCLLRDETTTILDRDQASDWWKIECSPRAEGSEGWVSGSRKW
jgi:hypothetical protein